MKIFYQWIFLWLSVCTYAQPSGTCTEGTTQLGSDGHLYGCVVNTWKKLSNNTATPTTFSTTEGSTGMVADKVILRTGGSNYELPATGFPAITGIPDAPTHNVGKVFYSHANQHFYQGINNDWWIQLDPHNLYSCDLHEIKTIQNFYDDRIPGDDQLYYDTCTSRQFEMNSRYDYFLDPNKTTDELIDGYCTGYHPNQEGFASWRVTWRIRTELKNCVLNEDP